MGNRITYLDGLKGLAAFIVVLHHFSLAFYPTIYTHALGEVHTGAHWEFLIYNSPLNLLFNGNFALIIFLVLSGFALSYRFFVTKNPAGLTEMAVTRYFRLLPPMVVSITGAWLLITIGANQAPPAAHLTGSWWWLGQAWTVHPNFWLALKQAFFDVYLRTLPGTETYNSSLWVIPIFFLGTFLVTGTLALIGTARKRQLVYVILALLNLNTYYLPLIVGMWFADLFVNQAQRLQKLAQPATILFLIIVGIYLGSYPTEHTHGQLIGTMYALLPMDKELNTVILYHTLGAVAGILAVLVSPALQGRLRGQVPLFLGKISYALFVIHVVVLVSLGSYLFITFTRLVTYSQAFLLMFLITFPIIILLAYVITRWVEQPFKTITRQLVVWFRS